jgi:hypothetical protein
VNPEAVAGKGLLIGQNVDTFDEYLALGKLPGSTRVADDHGAAVASLHQFEYTALDLTRTRKQLSVANNLLRTIGSDKSLTTLTLPTNVTISTDEYFASARMLDRLHLTAPNQTGFVTGGIKYDGERVTNWGVKAPGTTPTVVQALDSSSNWTISDSNTKADSSTSKDGGGSVQVNKVDATVADVYIERTGVAQDFTIFGQDTLLVWVFLPSGSLQKLATSGTAIEVRFGDSGLVNADRHNFSVGELAPGWNLLSMDVESPDATDGTGNLLERTLPAPSAIDTIRLRIVLKSNATTQSGFLWDYMHYNDEARTLVDHLEASAETEIDHCEDHTNWTINGSNTKADDAVDFEQGTQSIKIGRMDAGEQYTDLEQTGLSITTTRIYAFYLWYNPKTGTPVDNGTFWFTAGDAGLSNERTWKMTNSSGWLTSGDWNEMMLRATDTGDKDETIERRDASKVLDNSYQSSVVDTGGGLPTTVTDIRCRTDHGADTDTAGDSMGWDSLRYTLREDGLTSGTYSYKVTFLTEYGVESNASPASTSITTSLDKISLTSIPVSPDDSVIARRIYRDISGDAVYRFVDQIDDNVTTTYTDNIPDASLGSTQPPLAGDAFIDNSPASLMSQCIVYQNRVIGVDAGNKITLHFSDVGNPEAFRIVDQLTLEDEVVTLANHALGALIYTTDKVFLLSGDGVTSAFRVDEVTNQVGANGSRSVTRIKGVNFSVRESEAFIMADPSDPWFINPQVLDKFRALSNAQLANAHVIHDRGRQRVIVFAKTTSTYDKALVWQYGTGMTSQITGDGAGVDPLDIRQGGWFEMSLPASIDPQCSEIVETVADLPELWVGSADGYVYHLQDTITSPQPTTWATALTTTAMDAQFETTSVPLGAGAGGRGEPRYLKINTTGASETVWTVLVTLQSDASGGAIATKSFTITVPAGNASPIVPIPNIGRRAEWCKIKVSNATAAGFGAFRSMELFYIPRVDFRGARSS